MQRQSLNPEAAQVLRGMPLHERLRWFTDDWLRYDRVGNALVVTDLRMGIPGNYTFRFQMASRDSTGRWNAVTPTLWLGDGVGSMFNGEDLALIWRRIVQQQPPLPLAAWTEKYLGQREAGR